MPKQPDTRTDKERLDARITREQKAARFKKAIVPFLKDVLIGGLLPPFGGMQAARRQVMNQLDESYQESLTAADQQIANRIIDEELAKKMEALGLGHEEQTEHKKGGLKRKPRSRKLHKGGALLFGMKK
jgi:hypothetical protein